MTYQGYWLGKKRSLETRLKISEANKKRVYSHVGRKRTVAGYIKIYIPNHHRAQKDKYVLEHIVIMEKHIGRRLKSNECIHHINGIKDDNRVENLIVLTQKDHKSLHAKERWNKTKPSKEYFINEYLNNKKSTVVLSKQLKVSISTINLWIKECGIKMRKGNCSDYYGWAKMYSQCILCKKTEKPHQARGLCWKCYRLKY